jgi:peptide/nickel transport system substrate-binding protein
VATVAAGLAVAAAASSISAVAKSVSASVPSGGKRGGTLNLASSWGEPTGLVPWTTNGGNQDIFWQEQVYEHLVDLLPGSEQPQPGLATSWKIAKNGLTYTFHLRNAEFSNGTPITVQDVKFSLDRMINAKIQPTWNFLYKTIKDFTVAGPKTIVMHMKRVDVEILSALMLPGAGIYSEQAFNRLGAATFAQHPVTSGAFMIKAWIKGQELELVRNPYYWKTGQPYLDGVNILDIQDPNARTLKVESHEAQVAEEIPYEQVAAVDHTSGLTVRLHRGLVGWYLFLNHKTVPEFRDHNVDLALNYAVPKARINQAVLMGQGRISNSMMFQNGVFWNKNVPPYPYDLSKAKSLLAHSAFPHGFSFTVFISKGDAESISTASIIKNALQPLKINMTIQQVPDYFSLLTAGQYQAVMTGPQDFTSDIPDDAEHANVFFGNDPHWQNWHTGWNDPTLNKLVRQADSTFNNATRQRLYTEIQRKALADAPWVTLLNAPYETAVANNVKGFQVLPDGWWRLEDVYFAK